MTNPFEDRGDNLPDWALDEPTSEAPPEAAASSEAETQETETPAVPVAEAQQETTAAGEPTETESEQQVRLWAGKYKSAEELEKGYRELRELQTRTAERARAYEQARLEVEARAQQLEEALRRALPFVQQAVARQQQPTPEDPFVVPDPQPALTPDAVVPLVDKMVQERIAQVTAQAQQQFAYQQEYQEAVANVEAFFERHPEVERGGELDMELASTIMALNEAWARTGSTLDISSEDGLEIAYEAMRRPALRQVLEMHPEYVDTDAGMALARKLASELDGDTQAAQPATPAQRQMRPVPNTPVVERGSSPTPPQGTPLDEFEQAVAEWRGFQKRRGSDVFFGTGG